MLRGVVLALVALGVAPFTARRLTPSAALSRTALAIPAPAKDAFALYADLPQQPKWSPQFRSQNGPAWLSRQVHTLPSLVPWSPHVCSQKGPA